MNKLKILFAATFAIGIFLTVGSVKISAATCSPPDYIPSQCPKDYTPDYTCLNIKILKPNDATAKSCCINKCRNDSDVNGGTTQDPVRRLEAFGAKFDITASSIPKIINLAISAILGILSAYVLFRGVYVAAVKRTQTTSADEITKVNKELSSLIVGFIVLWSVIFIIQLVFGVLGLGNVTSINIGTDPNDKSVVIIE